MHLVPVKKQSSSQNKFKDRFRGSDAPLAKVAASGENSASPPRRKAAISKHESKGALRQPGKGDAGSGLKSSNAGGLQVPVDSNISSPTRLAVGHADLPHHVGDQDQDLGKLPPALGNKNLDENLNSIEQRHLE